MFSLPPEFISTIQNTFREEGHAFLKALPDMIAEASARWGLTDVQPVSNLSYNFVAFARRGTEDVILKMGTTNSEIDSELAALRLFNGEGACRLIEYDEERYWMLLERLHPGLTLATLEDDEEATHIAAEVMKRIWIHLDSASLLADLQEQAPAFHKFIRLADWFNGLKQLREMFNGGTGPLDEKLVERAESSAREFFAENHSPVLMHGDFHHYNVLSSERGWLVIDPKGVIGPACYEVGPLMMNPWGKLLNGTNYRLVMKRRIDILHEHLGLERERIREWSLAHAVLSAWWGIEDNTGWEYATAFAEMIVGLK
jgi:streptomycin 6-kinase